MRENMDSNWSECPYCNHKFKVFAIFIGNQYTCKNCKKQFVVSETSDNDSDKMSYMEYSDLFTGKLAVTYKFITGIQFKEALQLQNNEEQTGHKTTLAEIFSKHDILSPEKMKILQKIKLHIKITRMKKRFGTIALQGNFLSQENIMKGLEYQQNKLSSGKNIRIGDAFVKLGLLTEYDVKYILKEQQKIDVSLPEIKDILQEFYDHENAESHSGRAESKKSEVIKSVKETARTMLTCGLELIIQSDNLSASVKKTNHSEKQVRSQDVKQELTEFGITYGLVNDTILDLFLNEKTLESDTFEVAKGKKCIIGQHAKVRVFFEADHRLVGKMKKDGIIDFKDRGDIPSVKTGEILAEKQLMVKGEDGIDIYGQIIHTAEISDAGFACGKGADFSEDGGRILATCEGLPKLSYGGIISVMKEHHIKSDVGYETGHVNFDGNIIVDGTIQNGFSVTGVDLKAKEIHGGNVILSGDLEISGGILDADVTIDGTIKASYIKIHVSLHWEMCM